MASKQGVFCTIWKGNLRHIASKLCFFQSLSFLSFWEILDSFLKKNIIFVQENSAKE